MAEQVMEQQRTKLKLDDGARRALAQVYRLLLNLAEEADKERGDRSTAETDLEEAQK